MPQMLDQKPYKPDSAYLQSNLSPLFSGNHENQSKNSQVQPCKQLLTELIRSQQILHDKISTSLSDVVDKQINEGISYYNAKNMVFMNYLIHLHFYEIMKINSCDLTRGIPLKMMEKLIYLKTLLLKLGPIQKKLEYQTTKILKAGEIINVEPEPIKEYVQTQNNHQVQQEGYNVQQVQDEDEDLLAYQPRPKELMTANKRQRARETNQDKYVPPKLSSNLSKQQKHRKRIEDRKQRRKAFIVRKFRNQLVEGEEAQQQGVENELAQKIKQRDQQKTRYEEQNFMRFQENKKEKFLRNRLIRQQFKSNQLEEEFKEIKMISEVFRDEQVVAQAENKVRPASKDKHSLPKQGSKRVKMN